MTVLLVVRDIRINRMSALICGNPRIESGLSYDDESGYCVKYKIVCGCQWESSFWCIDLEVPAAEYDMHRHYPNDD